MAGIPSQPSLELRINLNLTWDNIAIFADNKDIVSRLRQNPFNSDDYILCLSGAKSSGKSLLANLWAKSWNAWYGKGDDWKHLANLLPIEGGCYVVDDISIEAKNQIMFWGVCVQLQNKKARMLITSLFPPREWSALDLPDLRTRLISSPQLQLLLPDDAQCFDLFKKHIESFGIKYKTKHDAVWKYSLIRIPRTYDSIRNFVNYLHEESLQRHTDISIPLARKALNRLINENNKIEVKNKDSSTSLF